MIEQTHGLILRTRPFTETSLIVEWLTPQFGRIRTVAKGARRSKSPFRGKLDLFYEADLSFSRSRRSELHTLCEVGLRDPHAALRGELAYVQQASYGAALIEQTTETGTPLPEIFKLMQSFLNHLPQQAPQPRNIYAFELKLLHELGLSPALADRRLTAETKALVRALSAENWPAIAGLRASVAAVTELNRFLHGFLVYHLGRIPKTRSSAVSARISV